MGDITTRMLQQDWVNQIGFLIFPNLDWSKLSANISQDIADRTDWLKDMDEKERELLEHTQKNLAQRMLEEDKAKTKKIAAIMREPFSKAFSPSASDSRSYDPANIFNTIIHDRGAQSTKLREESQYSLAFDDLHKRTKEHVLVVPKGNYISLSHFIDHAEPEEIVDFFRVIANTAERMGLAKHGYRIISNHAQKPGIIQNNDANQEVPHFHVHLAGGECLGQAANGVLSFCGPRGRAATTNPVNRHSL